MIEVSEDMWLNTAKTILKVKYEEGRHGLAVVKRVCLTSGNTYPPVELQILQKMNDHCDCFPCLYNYVLESDRSAVNLYLEYCENGDVGKWLKERWPEKRFFDIAESLSNALRHLHRAKISHGRICAEHVLVTADWQFKLSGCTCATMHSNLGQSTATAFRQDIHDLGELLLTVDERFPSQQTNNSRIYQMILQMLEPDSPLTAEDVYQSFTRKETVEHCIESVQLSFESSVQTGIHVPSCISLASTEMSMIQAMQRAKHEVMEGIKTLAALTRETFLDECQLTIAVHKLMKLLTEHGGSIAVAMVQQFFRCDVCKVSVLLYQVVVLGCGHTLCGGCLNRTVISHSLSRGLSSVSCPCCNTRFDPLKDEFLLHLEKHVIRELDSLMLEGLSQNCPQCGVPVFKEWGNCEVVMIVCPSCKYKFCGYCHKKAHIFSCKQWRRDRNHTKSLR